MHSVKELVGGLLCDGMIDAITKDVPTHIANTGLKPLITAEEVMDLASQLSTAGTRRVEIFREGKYIYKNGRRAKVDAKKLNALREKALLRVNYLHQGVPIFQELCGTLGEILAAEVRVNAYLSSSHYRGFGFHPDSHDILVWQQQGRKLWRVKDGNNKRIVVNTMLCVSGAVYVPVQHHHDPQAQGVESLHLTFGVTSPCREADRVRKRLLELW